MRAEHVASIEQLKEGTFYYVPESDYGKAKIWKIEDVWLLFEIPMYGGNPSYVAGYHKVSDMIEEIDRWT
jgi:hypothetical protein